MKQWRILHAVHDCGSFAEAASKVHLTQPTISYSITQIQEQLGIEIYRLEGRKAILNEVGKKMLERSRNLLKEAAELEEYAKRLAIEPLANLWLVVERAFPGELLSRGINAFSSLIPQTKVVLINGIGIHRAQSVLSELPSSLAITSRVPDGFHGERFVDLDYVPVARASHPMFSAQDVTLEQMRHIEQIVVGDRSEQMPRHTSALPIARRYMHVPDFSAAIDALRSGTGYAWLPRLLLDTLEQESDLRILRPDDGEHSYRMPFYLVRRLDEDADSGPATLASTLKRMMSF